MNFWWKFVFNCLFLNWFFYYLWFLLSDIDEVIVFGSDHIGVDAFGWLFLGLFFIKKEIHQFYFIDISFIFRTKYLLWCIWIFIDLWRNLISFFGLFLFLKFNLNNAEKIFELIILLWHNIFG